MGKLRTHAMNLLAAFKADLRGEAQLVEMHEELITLVYMRAEECTMVVKTMATTDCLMVLSHLK